MHRKTNKVFTLYNVLARLAISELVWYLANEMHEVRKLTHEVSIIFMKLIGTIHKESTK